jgi:dihydropteroate synthase
MSSRPGAEIISEEKELERVLLHVQNILKHFPNAIISIDTIHASVAEECIKAGAHIINDITAGRFDSNMIGVVAKHKVPFVIMHMQGMPNTMQQNPQYENVVNEVMDFFAERISVCRNAGITDLILDTGFGFGKTIEHNYTLLRNLKQFSTFNLPLLTGVSRKGMITKLLNIKPEDALNGTTVLNTIALMNGTSVLRVHDVKEAKQAVKLYHNQCI